jgi:hypothetical protein
MKVAEKVLEGFGLKSLLLLAFGFLCFAVATPSFAWHGGGYHGSYHGGYYRGYHGGYYHGGYYRRGFYGPAYGYGGGYYGGFAPGFVVGTAAGVITGAAIVNQGYGCRRVYTRCGVYYDTFGYPHRTCSRYVRNVC